MDTAKYLRHEFELRILNESYDRIHRCLLMVTQEQVWSSPNTSIVPIGCLVKHLLGNVQQWVYAGLLEGDFKRDRDAEFVLEPEKSAADLHLEMERVKELLLSKLDELTEAHLTRELIIQGFKVTGFSAIVHVIEHFSYHTGQITTLTKLHTSLETNYYQGNDLNAG